MTSRLPSLARHLARRRASSRPSALPALRATYASSPFQTYPSPPRLPAEEQAEFERLQRGANTQEPLDPAAQQINPAPSTASPVNQQAMRNEATLGEVSNLPLRKGAPPEFDGDTNPKTGEVGGPKNEPLRWGSAGDWSYNGRVTDF
ncbi:hypothetical protein BJ170DRAFT_588078 [Xylariales sp. AK1849]|nr:hypothetical protein BJ170DRAFT_588078 [Xylariales sp. AK1849]